MLQLQPAGSIASKCHSKAELYTGQECPKPVSVIQEGLEETPPTVIEGVVDGVPVQDILVDTGAAKTMVYKDLVSKENMMGKESEISIRCAHGDSVKYPLARVTVTVKGKPYPLVAAVSETLPMSVLLGRDLPVLVDFCKELVLQLRCW